MKLKEIIVNRVDEFSNLCQTHDVRTLYAFGSSTRGHFDDEKSDIDLLVKISEDDPIKRGEKLISLWDKLEVFFDRKVDLLTDSSINNPVLRSTIDKTKILIYDGKGQKVLV